MNELSRRVRKLDLVERDDAVDEVRHKFRKIKIDSDVAGMTHAVSAMSISHTKTAAMSRGARTSLSLSFMMQSLTDNILQALARAAVLFELKRTQRETSTYLNMTRRSWKRARGLQEQIVWERLDNEEGPGSPADMRPENETEAWAFIKARELIDERYYVDHIRGPGRDFEGYYTQSYVFDEWRKLDDLGDISTNRVFYEVSSSRCEQNRLIVLFEKTHQAARRYHHYIADYRKRHEGWPHFTYTMVW